MRFPPNALSALAALTVSLASISAVAQTSATKNPDWIRDQMDEDITPVPTGMGALFVPAMTDASLEPPVIVFSGGKRVAAGRTGERIVLPPGAYRIVVGQGKRDNRAAVEVRVTEGVTTPVEPFYGAVRISIADEDGKAVNETYVISTADGQKVYGPRDVSNDPEADLNTTWILSPGKYVVSLGSSPLARRNSMAFAVVSGATADYRIVVDDGDVVRTEFGEAEFEAKPSIWRLRWVLGGEGSGNIRENQFTGFNGTSLTVNAFSRLEGGIDTGPHLALLTFNVNQAFVGLDSEYGSDVPFRTLTNEAEAELLYTFRAGGILGPYVRGLARTGFAEDHYMPDGDVLMNTVDKNGRLIQRSSAGLGDRVRLTEAFSPLTFQEGAGLSLTLLDSRTFTLIGRGGVAARQARYDNARFVTGRNGQVVTLEELDDNAKYGGEITAVGGLRIGTSFTYETRFDSFIPSAQLIDDDKFRPIFRWDNTVALRVSRAASAVYNFSLRRDEVQLDDLQVSHGMAIRLQHVLF